LPVGALAVNATTELEDLFLDSELAQQLSDLADENADADAREIILNRLEELKDNPDVAQVIGELTNQSSEEPAEEPEQDVTESRGADYEFETEVINPEWLSWESYEETEDNPLPPEPEKLIPVTVSYSMSGSHNPATWGDGGGTPEESPEIRIVSVIDDMGQELDPKSVVADGGGDLRDKAADDYYSMDEGREDPLIQLRRSAGIHEDDMEEGLKGKLAAIGLAGATALGGYAAGSHSPSGFSNTKGIDQFNKPTTSQVAPATKSRADQLADLNKTLAPPGTKASKIVNLPSDFEEEKEMDEGREDPLIQLRRSAGIHEDDMEEGFGTAAKKAIGAGAIGLAALGSGGAQAQTTDQFDPSWNSHGMTHHIRSDMSSTKGMNSADPSKDTNNFEKRIQKVTGPNAKGEYKVTVMQGHDIVSNYVTKTPPPNWLYNNNEVDEGLGSKLAGLGVAAAIGATGMAGYKDREKPTTGFSNPPSASWTQPASQKQQPVAAPAAKKQGNGFSNPPPKNWVQGSGESKLVNKPSDFEEEKEMDEGALADIGDYVGGKLGGAAGLALSKGKIGAGKVGSRAGRDLLRKGGQWADNKIDKWLSSPEPEAKPTTGKSTPKMTAESGNLLAGQYGHSGKMKPVVGGDSDTISRLKFLSGITK
jgi:hypothetical protein